MYYDCITITRWNCLVPVKHWVYKGTRFNILPSSSLWHYTTRSIISLMPTSTRGTSCSREGLWFLKNSMPCPGCSANMILVACSEFKSQTSSNGVVLRTESLRTYEQTRNHRGVFCKLQTVVRGQCWASWMVPKCVMYRGRPHIM